MLGHMQKINHFWAQIKKNPKCQLGRFCFNYSFIFVLISLTSFISMQKKKQKNFHTKMRLVSPISN